MPLILKGVMQAPVTPFKEDFSLDVAGLERAADFHVRTGATGITWPYHKSECDRRTPCGAARLVTNTESTVKLTNTSRSCSNMGKVFKYAGTG